MRATLFIAAAVLLIVALSCVEAKVHTGQSLPFQRPARGFAVLVALCPLLTHGAP
jgi:hypothetical protein